MGLRLVDSNAVVVAKHFNPSIFSQVWLTKLGLLDGDGLEGNFVFTNVLAHGRTRDFVFTVTPDQLQFHGTSDDDTKGELLAEKVGKIVRELPHTPFTAIGLNFLWQLEPERVDVQTISRRLFFVQGGRLHRAFDAPDAQFGAYMSRDVLGCRLKLEIKPVAILKDDPEKNVALLLGFNFHLDLPPAKSPVEAITDMINEWGPASLVAAEIARGVAEEDRP